MREWCWPDLKFVFPYTSTEANLMCTQAWQLCRKCYKHKMNTSKSNLLVLTNISSILDFYLEENKTNIIRHTGFILLSLFHDSDTRTLIHQERDFKMRISQTIPRTSGPDHCTHLPEIYWSC